MTDIRLFMRVMRNFGLAHKMEVLKDTAESILMMLEWAGTSRVRATVSSLY